MTLGVTGWFVGLALAAVALGLAPAGVHGRSAAADWRGASTACR